MTGIAFSSFVCLLLLLSFPLPLPFFFFSFFAFCPEPPLGELPFVVYFGLFRIWHNLAAIASNSS